MFLITIHWGYIFAPLQILGKVIVLLLCFGEEGQTGKILSETVIAKPRKRLSAKGGNSKNNMEIFNDFFH